MNDVSSEEEIDRREEGGRHEEAEEREALGSRQEGSRDEEAHHGETENVGKEDRPSQASGQEDDEEKDHHASEDRRAEAGGKEDDEEEDHAAEAGCQEVDGKEDDEEKDHASEAGEEAHSQEHVASRRRTFGRGARAPLPRLGPCAC